MLNILKRVTHIVQLTLLAVALALPLTATAGNFYMFTSPQSCSPINPVWTNDVWSSPNGLVNIGDGVVWIVCSMDRDQQQGPNDTFGYVQNIGDTDQTVGCALREYDIFNGGTIEATFAESVVPAGTGIQININNPDPGGASNATSFVCKLQPKTVFKGFYHRPFTDD